MKLNCVIMQDMKFNFMVIIRNMKLNVKTLGEKR